MPTSHEISRSLTPANESTGYASMSGLTRRSWAVVSGWIMMMVIRKDPEKPIDFVINTRRIKCHGNVAF